MTRYRLGSGVFNILNLSKHKILVPIVDVREKKIILLVASLASFLVPYTGSSITVALPAMTSQFSVDAVTLSWITSAYIISAALFIAPFGRLADIYGCKKIFIEGVLFFSIASLASTLAPTAGNLFAARFIQGIWGAMIFATSVAIVTQVYDQGKWGWVLGITIATVSIVFSIGPFLGGLPIDRFGLPVIFLINIPIGLIILAVTVQYVKHEWADAVGERFDLTGALGYGIVLFLGIFGMMSLLSDPGGLVWLVAAVGAAGVFVWWERRCATPLFNFAFFSGNLTFVFSNIAAMFNYGATFTVAVLLSLYLKYIHGFSAEYAGFIRVAHPVVQTFISPVAGKLFDRISPASLPRPVWRS